MLQKPDPILVVERFPALLDALLGLLDGLSPAEWDRATVAGEWTVKDIALHLLGDDLGFLSGKRDGFSEPHPPLGSWAVLVDWINARNDVWVRATRRLSPRVLCDLLRSSGDQVNAYFRSMDVYALGGAVSWAGSQPAPVWLDLAREFTERWHHQQHIREALGQPGLIDPYFLGPVLAAFVFGLPRSLEPLNAPSGTVAALSIAGPSGGVWSVVREADGWQLYTGKPDQPDAEVTLPEDAAWRLFTKGLTPAAARPLARITGDQALGERLLETVSIIA